MTTNTDHLRTYFLAYGRTLNASGLEVRLGLPKRTLRDWLAGREPMPARHVPKLVDWAKFFGYRADINYVAIP